ncbi:MAG: aminotransferase class I/II-fold pyridoxal phosphate-dependent enzyme [Gammaproteobacteria bacterium]|nr:aminotransferase class I/II-fold pyridoxal phosphate-dependent enzyme [Gammaproteobacteria bacterium]
MLKLSGQGPLYLQLYRAIQQDILTGALISGDQLPASRELAKTLSLSRNVVVQCYEQLASEGYIHSKQGAGSFISDVFIHLDSSMTQESAQIPQPTVEISQNAKSMLPMWEQYRLDLQNPITPKIDFQYGNVGVDHRLEQQLRTNLRNQGAGISPNYQHPAGLIRLREVIAKYVRQYRGVNCRADQILITNGSQEGLTIVAQMLLNPGDSVIMEDPGYRGATQSFKSVSAQISTVNVDRFGLCTEELPVTEGRGSPSHVKLLYTTPSHQFPTGGVMPLERRIALLQWAKSNQVMILEDDYDSEFRYQGPPIESIHGMDDSSQTIYMGTFSKIISPVLRTGFLVLPDQLIEPACAIQWTHNRHSPLVIQQMLGEYLDSVHFIRHLRRMRKRYSERRTVLIEALDEHFGDQIRVHGTNAGIHLTAWTSLPVERESELIQIALDHGLGIHTVTSLYRKTPKNIGLLMGYANLANSEIRKGVKILAQCVKLIDPPPH